MESRVAELEQIARRIVACVERIERRFDAIDQRFDAYDRRFDTIEGRYAGRSDALEWRIDRLARGHRRYYRWLSLIMLGGFGVMLGALAHGFHWL
jgi:uncharacterized membrane protein YjjP (DUF1212 family)